MITKKTEYDKMVSEFRGAYPVFLTSDGTEIDYEHDGGYDQWVPTWTIIDKIRDSDNWPTYADANRRRILVKKGFRGQELIDKINGWEV